MKQLDREGLQIWNRRFRALHDASVENVELSLSSEPTMMRWKLRALDYPEDFVEWGQGPQPVSRILTLELRDLEAFSAKMLPNYDWVVYEASIDFVGDQVYVDFDYQSNEHAFVSERFNDPDNWTWLESSWRYALASELWWEVK